MDRVSKALGALALTFALVGVDGSAQAAEPAAVAGSAPSQETKLIEDAIATVAAM